jgi:hypothetical protein
LLLHSFSSSSQFLRNPRGAETADPVNKLQVDYMGKLSRTTTGKPVEYASVQLLQNRMDTVTKQRKETVIGGMLTQANGDFSVDNVPVFGPLKLR